MVVTTSYRKPAPPRASNRLCSFEIFVGRGFCEFETSAISQTLNCANEVLGEDVFDWRYVSETPGLLKGRFGMIVRAEPAVQNHDLADALIVVGGGSGVDTQWLARMRQMQRLSRPTVLLSDAATAFIKRTQSPSGNVTTHWHDALGLFETGHHPKLTNALSEVSAGITTAAGSGATMEITISLIAPMLNPADLAEIGNRLLLQVVRTPHSEQPKDITSLPALSDARVKEAVQTMEASLDIPLNVYELAAKVGVSTRHLERMFKDVFNQTPARFYKQLRTNKARSLIEDTQLSMVEIAVATGFGSNSSMSAAIKQKYGVTPKKMRIRRVS